MRPQVGGVETTRTYGLRTAIKDAVSHHGTGQAAAGLIEFSEVVKVQFFGLGLGAGPGGA